jgi:hypothetical protein
MNLCMYIKYIIVMKSEYRKTKKNQTRKIKKRGGYVWVAPTKPKVSSTKPKSSTKRIKTMKYKSSNKKQKGSIYSMIPNVIN